MAGGGSNEICESSTASDHSSAAHKSCLHRTKVILLTSWTERNPGRRFLCCKYWKDEDRNCKYFEWCDSEISKHTKRAVRGLMNANESLLMEKEKIAEEIKILQEKNESLEKEIVQLRLNVRNDDIGVKCMPKMNLKLLVMSIGVGIHLCFWRRE